MDYHISVVVPVYNCENILPTTLGNLLNQTKKEIEIILVNDASTDGSLRILEDARTAFGERVRVVDLKMNGGPGAARNAGLDVAIGSYIGFMDADDLVDTSMYEKLYSIAVSSGADIVDCAFFKDSTESASIHFSGDCIGELDGKKRSTLISCGGYIWSKLFRRELITENNIKFRNEYALEDADFLVKAICHANTVSSTEDVLYRYRDTEGSLSKEEDFEKYIEVQLKAMEAVFDAGNTYNNYEEIRDAVEYMILCMYKNIALKVFEQTGGRKVNRQVTGTGNSGVSDGVSLRYMEEARDLRFKIVKKNPKNNRFVRSKFDRAELDAIKKADSFS